MTSFPDNAKNTVGYVVVNFEAASSSSFRDIEAHHTVGVDETPRRFFLKRCRHSSLQKFEDAVDTTLDLMHTKPSDAAFWAVFEPR